MAVQPRVARLKSSLMKTGLQQKDNALFQVISQLIDFIEQSIGATSEEIATGGGGSSVPDLSAKPFLTHDVATGLSNYRQLLAGTGISFDDTVASERTINNTSVASEWDVLTNGDGVNPELIFTSDGDVIMLET